MGTKNLVALADRHGRGFSYATRRLRPGDPFQASDRDARLLIALKKAAIAREPGHVPAPPPELAKRLDPLDHDGDGRRGGSSRPPGDLRTLRAEYLRVVGKRAFNGWPAATLQAKIAAAGK